MAWLDTVKAELAAGRAVQLRGSGPSMAGRIDDGAYVTLSPVADVRAEDMVLVRVPSGKHYVHLVREVAGGKYLIGNMRGEIDGWVERADILGTVTRVGNDPRFGGVTVRDDE
ncbi:MAG: S24/S26 family peptidase [Gemmataceae bacterium]|nr:S24/S26 family peptidase [Gemmataceae bacterium]